MPKLPRLIRCLKILNKVLASFLKFCYNILMTDTTLAVLLASKKATTLAWVAEDPTNRSAGCYVQDLAHWNEMGIHTAADLVHYELAVEVYEQTKSTYGHKPSWKVLNEMSNAELERESAVLSEAYASEVEWEKTRKLNYEAEMEYQDRLTEAEGSLQIEGELQFTEGHWNTGAAWSNRSNY